MKKLGFIALFLCCCMALNLSMVAATDVETASDAELPAAVEEAQPDADAEITATDVEAASDAELPSEDEELNAELFAENIAYDKTITGGVIYFDAVNGIVKECVANKGEEVTSAEIPAAIFGVLVTKIADKAFQKCPKLTSITLPDSLTEIGASTFAGLTKLTDVRLSNNLVKIGNSAFSGCTGLADLSLPDSITTLGTGVFSGCVRLNNVVLPARLTAIPQSAFNGCTSLSSITIATNVTNIGKNAFANCSKLSEMRYKGTLQQWLGITIGDGNRTLIDKIDEDASFEVKSPKVPPVIIKSVEIYDINVAYDTEKKPVPLKTIPTGQFLASVTITGLDRLEDAVVFFASYSMDGKYEGLMYAFVQTTAGATTKVTLPIDNPNGNISQIRAFAVRSLSDLTPLSNPVSFPAL